MASIDGNLGIGRARGAHEALSLDLGKPLTDALDSVERRAGIPVAVFDLGEGFAGAYLRCNGRPLILLNGAQPPPRQRFTLAHEFAHHWLDHGSRADDSASLRDLVHDPVEVQANYFAAEFLVPRVAATAWCADELDGPITLESVVRLAAHFGISAQAALIRLTTVRILVDRALCRRLEEEIEEGLHRELAERLGLSDLSDGIAAAAAALPRIPPALEGSALVDFLRGDLDAAGLAGAIGRPVEDVERAAQEFSLR